MDVRRCRCVTTNVWVTSLLVFVHCLTIFYGDFNSPQLYRVHLLLDAFVVLFMFFVPLTDTEPWWFIITLSHLFIQILDRSVFILIHHWILSNIQIHLQTLYSNFLIAFFSCVSNWFASSTGSCNSSTFFIHIFLRVF